LQSTLAGPLGAAALSAHKADILGRLIKDGEVILRQLGELLQQRLIKLPGQSGRTQKVRRLEWVKTRSRVEKLRQKLRDLRLTIAVQLAGINM
jgi:hypothetical protein